MRSLCCRASLDHPVGLGFGVGEKPVSLRAGVVDHRLRLGGRRGHHRVRVRLRVMQHRIARVQDVLGVVQFAGNRILDVVDQFQHVTAGHDATGCHRHATGFFDNGAQLVQRFKDSVHGHTLLASEFVVTSVPGVTSVTAVITPVCRAQFLVCNLPSSVPEATRSHVVCYSVTPPCPTRAAHLGRRPRDLPGAGTRSAAPSAWADLDLYPHRVYGRDSGCASGDVRPSGGPSGRQSVTGPRPRAGADGLDDLGDPVGADPGLCPVRGGAGRGAALDDRVADGRRPAADLGRRGRTRCGIVIVLVCRGGPGPIAVPQGRQLHRRHGVRDRLDQSGGGVGHHPGAVDGLAVHRGGIRRRAPDDHRAGAVVPALRASAAHRRRPRAGREGTRRLDGRPCGHGHVDPGRRFLLAAALFRARPDLGVARVRDGVAGDPA